MDPGAADLYPEEIGKMRPLGIPTWSDKLRARGVRLILEAYYEPQFSPHSHGFRPARLSHGPAEITKAWVGVKWFIEGDISGCFDSFDHSVLLSILREKIHDGRFLRLVWNLLTGGISGGLAFDATLSGVPQGGIVSPILVEYLPRSAGPVRRPRAHPSYNVKPAGSPIRRTWRS